MKNECRKGIPIRSSLLLGAMLVLMSLLTACSTEPKINSYYDLDVVEHTPDFFVNDFAGVFSEAQKNELIEKAVAFDNEYDGIQVVITTVESLDEAVLDYEYVVEDVEGNRVESSEANDHSNPKFAIEEVAYSMYNQYGIGQADMGILILFSTGDREVRIENGRMMQFYITDSVSGRILDEYGMDYFIEDKFAEGLISVQAALIDEIKTYVSSDWYTDFQEAQADSENAEVGAVTGDSTENSGEIVVASENTEENDSGKGILFGFFGSVTVAFAAIVVCIRQSFKGKSEKATLEKAKQEEVESLKASFQTDLAERERIHEAKVSSLERDHQHRIREKNDRMEELRGYVNDAQREIQTLKTQLEVITDKYNRAQRLHPEYNFDDEVHGMIESEYKVAAKELDGTFAEVLDTPAAKDNSDVFSRALFLFDTAKPEVKKYVTSDRSAIQELYNEAVRLKQEFQRAQQEKRDKAAARAAYEEIKSVYDDNPRGNHHTYKELHAALAIFSGLSAAEKAFFPDNNLIEKLKKLHHSAESDHKDYEVACAAESNVRSIIHRMSSADEDDRDKLAKAMRYYRNLNSAQQAYFPDELLHKLKQLIDEANDDHRRQERKRADEAAAAARRRAMHSSFSSFSSHSRSSSSSSNRSSSSSFSSSSRSSSSSHSSFSGRGGRSGGGGASRRF